MILDTTAGNRFMWPDKDPPNTIFLDKETRLKISPDVFADFKNLPFRENLFDCIFFDPPHHYGSIPKFFNLPHKTHGGFYGCFDNRRDMVVSIIKASEEFKRYTKRLCFKWHDAKIKFWNILGLFNGWKLVNEYSCRPRNVRGVHHRTTGGKWFTFVLPPKR